MPESPLYPRLVQARLIEALAASPVVLIHGPRQCGKTTLARKVGERKGYGYVTFDDDVAATVTAADFRGLRKQAQAGRWRALRARSGAL